MSSHTQFEGRAIGAIVIGDSSTVLFNNLLFRDDRLHDAVFAFHSQYLARFRALDLVAEDESIGVRLRDALGDTALVDRESGLTPVYRSDRLRDLSNQYAELATRGGLLDDRPILAFSVGYFDYAEILLQLGPTVDVRLPDDLYGTSPVEAVGSANLIPLSRLETLVMKPLHSFERAFTLLVEAGFESMYAIGLRPPSLDDRGFEARCKVRSRAHLRYKVAMLFNARLAAICGRVGVVFVDPWPLLSVDGVFDPRFELDHMHVNSAGTQRIAERIVGDYAQRRETPD